MQEESMTVGKSSFLGCGFSFLNPQELYSFYEYNLWVQLYSFYETVKIVA